jgi:hypothetical protein
MNKPKDYIKYDDNPNPMTSQGPVYDDIRKLADHVYHNKPGIPSYRPQMINHQSSFVPASRDNF